MFNSSRGGDLPVRRAGWLNVWAINCVDQLYLFDGGTVPVAAWLPRFCVLSVDEQLMRYYLSEREAEDAIFAVDDGSLKMVRLDRGGGGGTDYCQPAMFGDACFDDGAAVKQPKSGALRIFRRSRAIGNLGKAKSPWTRDSSYDRAVDEDNRRRAGETAGASCNASTPSGDPGAAQSQPLFSVEPDDDSESGQGPTPNCPSLPDTPTLKPAHLYVKKGLRQAVLNIRRAGSIGKLDKKKSSTSAAGLSSGGGSSSTGSIATTASTAGGASGGGATPSPNKGRDIPEANGWSISGSGGLYSRLKRSMSLTKLARKRGRPKLLHEADSGSVTDVSTATRPHTQKIKTAHSYESLLAGGQRIRACDVSRESRAQVQPLHSSVLGQENCFQVVTGKGTTFYGCQGWDERERWIGCLRKTINPGEDNSRRTDISLKLWIQEAKNCPSKKRYFCEITLDKTVYARTSTKTKGEMLFWGEQFEFDNLPAISAVTFTLFKDGTERKKPKQRNGSDRGATSVGCVSVDVGELLNRQVSEKWYVVGLPPVQGKVARDAKGAAAPQEGAMQLRVKARYQAVRVLPLASYIELSQYVQQNYVCLVNDLDPLLAVRAKDDLANILVNVLHHEGKATAFLCDIVMADVQKQDNCHLTFRGNTIATKAIEAYMKLVGARYLRATLGEFVRAVLDSVDDCEVDPSKLPASSTVLLKHQANLVRCCETAWAKIAGSLASFPSELREVFAVFRGRCRDIGKAALADNLISACVFLRLLCPAIMSPSLFGLCQEFPDERASRTLTLVAKTIQSLANFTKFGAKEDYMTHMNEFVDREWGHMHDYLQRISSIDSKHRRIDFDGRVDVAKQLSLLHSLLAEELKVGGRGSSPPESSPCSDVRRRLLPLLQQLSDELEHEEDGAVTGNGGSAMTENAAYGMLDFGSARTPCTEPQKPRSGSDERRVPSARRRPISSDEYVEIVSAVADNKSAAISLSGTAAKRKDANEAQRTTPRPIMRAPLKLAGTAVSVNNASAMESSRYVVRRPLEADEASSVQQQQFFRSGGAEVSDSAYDTLRSTGSCGSGGAGGGLSDGGGSSSASGLFDTLRSNSSCGSSSSTTKRVVRHKVWDRVLTANDLITGDYVDLISYVDEKVGGAATPSGEPVSVTTTTTAAALLSGHASAGWSVADEASGSTTVGAPDNTFSRKNVSSNSAPAATASTRPQPLTFFNPAFRSGTSPPGSAVDAGGEHVEVASSCSASTRSWQAPDRFASLNSRPKPPSLHDESRLQLSLDGRQTVHHAGVWSVAQRSSAVGVQFGCTSQQHPVATGRRSATGAAPGSASSASDRIDAAGDERDERNPSVRLPADGFADVDCSSLSNALNSDGSGAWSRLDCLPAPRLRGGENSRDRLTNGSSDCSPALPTADRPRGWAQPLQTDGSGGGAVGSYSRMQTPPWQRGEIVSPVGVAGRRCVGMPGSSEQLQRDEERESVERLKQQLEDAQRRLEDTELRLARQADQTSRAMNEWRQRLEASEENLRAQAKVKDEQIDGIVQSGGDSGSPTVVSFL